MKLNMLVLCGLSAAIVVGCNKNNSPTEAGTTDKSNARGGVNYVSDQEQYVQSLQQEIAIDNPDALLDDLNESVGDSSHNAELVRLNSQEEAPVSPLEPAPPTSPERKPAPAQ